MDNNEPTKMNITFKISRWRCNVCIIYESEVSGTSAILSFISESCNQNDFNVIVCDMHHKIVDKSYKLCNWMNSPSLTFVQFPWKANRIHVHSIVELCRPMCLALLMCQFYCMQPASYRCHSPICEPVFWELPNRMNLEH